MQPSELNEMDYYEYWYIVKDLIEHLKKEKEAQDGQNSQQNEAMSGMRSGMKMPNMSMPKMPSMKMK
jgi:hypothetical protein